MCACRRICRFIHLGEDLHVLSHWSDAACVSVCMAAGGCIFMLNVVLFCTPAYVLSSCNFSELYSGSKHFTQTPKAGPHAFGETRVYSSQLIKRAGVLCLTSYRKHAQCTHIIFHPHISDYLCMTGYLSYVTHADPL